MALSSIVDINLYSADMGSRLTFGEWLADSIYTAGYDQTTFAAALGVVPGAVNNWVGDKHSPDKRYWADIARLLGVERDEIKSRIAAEKTAKPNVRGKPKGVRAAQRRQEVQLFPRVPASRPTWIAMESERRMIELPESWLRDVRAPAMAVEVNGDCLTARGILDGDLVICEPVLDPKAVPQGKVVLVRVEDEYTLKVLVWVSEEHAELRDGTGAVISTLSEEVDFEVLGVARKRWGDVL